MSESRRSKWQQAFADLCRADPWIPVILWLAASAAVVGMTGCATAAEFANAPEGAVAWLGRVLLAVVEDVSSILTGGFGAIGDVLALFFG